MLATSRAYDDDHAARIARHKAERGPEWTTIEEPRAIARPELAGRVVVVDCVTLWLTNFFADAAWKHEPRPRRRARRARASARAIDATWIFVSNELGCRRTRRRTWGESSSMCRASSNQEIASRADAVTLMVAGLPLAVKGEEGGSLRGSGT